ncbi:MAG TPA: hypothetical protein VH415_16310 [Nitrososphaeraceae archaeon]
MELVDAGFPATEIAKKLDTSVDYVYKVNSKKKNAINTINTEKQGRAVEAPNNNQITTNTVNPDLDYQPDLQSIRTSDQIHYYYDFKPVTEKQLMDIYSRFDKNEDAAKVIAATGILPQIVQVEFVRFLNSKSRNPFELQDEIIKRLGDAPKDLQLLARRAKDGLLLTNQELLLILNYENLSNSDSSLLTRISNSQLLLPEGLIRFKCNFCEKSQGGIIIDKNSDLAKDHDEMISKFTCKSCLTKVQEAMKGNWDFGRYAPVGTPSKEVEKVNNIDSTASGEISLKADDNE